MDLKTGANSLEARIRDMLRLAASGGKVRFSYFLDEKETFMARELIQREKADNILFWGGYPNAERVMLGVFPGFMQPDEQVFPITAITADYRKCDRLSHRDFLGALLHSGIERSALGDILVEEGRCVFFCRREISGFLLSQITKIGGVGVRLTAGASEPLPAAHHFKEWTAVIASARLDCAVAAAACTSREKASGLIRSGLVQLNHEIVVSPAEAVHAGDKLSIRGKGRFVLDQIGPVTKKGRLLIRGRKYL
ncbi:MAG: S4 domain-containing protein [Oscillospiraceae bacterium]|jgi:RNA-binding protein YlmH